MDMIFPSNQGRVAARGLLLRSVVGCPCMYQCLRYSRHECTKQQNWKLLRIDVSNTPKIAALPVIGFYLFFNSILIKYYKPVHPSPLAFIIMSLEKFPFSIALSFVVVFSLCLNYALVSCRMNSVIAGRHARHKISSDHFQLW